MAKFTAKVRVIILCNFNAENPEDARKIAPQKVWDEFDEIDAICDGIELDEIEEVLSVDDDNL